MATAKVTAAMFSEVEWEVYHAMKGIDAKGVFPTGVLCCEALAHLNPSTVKRSRRRILAWDLIELRTGHERPKYVPVQRKVEPYSSPTVTAEEQCEVESSRVEVLTDSILEMLEGRERRKNPLLPPSVESGPDIIEIMISRAFDRMPLASAVRTILDVWDTNFASMGALA